MIDKLQKLGIGGILGFLVGIVAVLFGHTSTDAGAAIIVVICIMLGIAFSALIKAIRLLIKRKYT